MENKRTPLDLYTVLLLGILRDEIDEYLKAESKEQDISKENIIHLRRLCAKVFVDMNDRLK